MTVTLSGRLERPVVDQPLADATVVFVARQSSDHVIAGTQSLVKTDENGEYSIDLHDNRYDIGIQVERGPVRWLARSVAIDADSSASDINDVLRQAESDAEITPSIIVEAHRIQRAISDAGAAAQQSADAAQQAERNAGDSAGAAQTAADRAGENQSAAETAQTSAGIAATNAGGYADAAGDSAEAASASADRAESAADQLEQLITENNALRALVDIEHGRPLLRDGRIF